jgi:MFS family permease
MLTGAAWNFFSLIVTRFLFGAGEAGAWPCAARTFSRWIPQAERGRIQGIFFSGAHLAGGVTPMIVLALLQVIDWRAVFVLFGFLGVAWAIAWHRWFRDEPAEHQAVNAAERAMIEADRAVAADHPTGWAYWRRLLGHRNTLPLCLMYLPNSFGFYFCITWLPTFLKEKHGFDSVTLGFFAGLPLLLSVGGDLLGGVATDAVTKRFGLRLGRAGVGAGVDHSSRTAQTEQHTVGTTLQVDAAHIVAVPADVGAEEVSRVDSGNEPADPRGLAGRHHLLQFAALAEKVAVGAGHLEVGGVRQQGLGIGRPQILEKVAGDDGDGAADVAQIRA